MKRRLDIVVPMAAHATPLTYRAQALFTLPAVTGGAAKQQ
ncbi:hypothetical protein P308_20090 [Pseudomonas piscis]|nr:hypothetical protein P308_20090 [Pseudomonas piscis]